MKKEQKINFDENSFLKENMILQSMIEKNYMIIQLAKKIKELESIIENYPDIEEEEK